MSKEFKLAHLAVDPEVSTAGRWVHISYEAQPGVRFGMCCRVARFGNPEHQKRIALSEISREDVQKLRSGKLKLTKDDAEIAADLASTVFLDFGTGKSEFPVGHVYHCPGGDECMVLVDADGEPLRGSDTETRTMLMLLAPELRSGVQVAAQNAAVYRQELVEETGGNSGRPSDGASGTAPTEKRSSGTKRRAKKSAP